MPTPPGGPTQPCCATIGAAKRTVELRDFRRCADRPAAHQRPGADRARPAVDPGARLLAHEGPDGRSGHPERGRLRLPPVPAGPDHQPDRLRHRSAMLDKPGGIFVRRLEQISDDDLILLQSGRAHRAGRRKGTLAEQLERRSAGTRPVPALAPTRPRSTRACPRRCRRAS
jgi:hypothetical protein